MNEAQESYANIQHKRKSWLVAGLFSRKSDFTAFNRVSFVKIQNLKPSIILFY